jgi:hypothetical protein
MPANTDPIAFLRAEQLRHPFGGEKWNELQDCIEGVRLFERGAAQGVEVFKEMQSKIEDLEDAVTEMEGERDDALDALSLAQAEIELAKVKAAAE